VQLGPESAYGYPQAGEITGDDLVIGATTTIEADNTSLGPNSGFGTAPETIIGNVSLGAGSEASNITNDGSILVPVGIGVTDEQSATFTNDGAIIVNGGSLDVITGTFTNDSTVTVENGGVFNVESAAVLDGTGTVLMESGSTTSLAPSVPVNGGQFFFSDPATLIIADPATFSGTIGGLAPGDVIEIPGDTITGGSITGTTLALTLSTGGTLDFNAAPGQSGVTFTTAPGGGLSVACFAAGTTIRTARGDIAVEHLRVGEPVLSAFGGSVPIVWLGHRHVDCRAHPRPQDVMPVRVRAGAFGDGLPRRDLCLSPDHAVFVDGVLVPVRYLLNGATIVQETAVSVTYWHVECGQHDVLLAEGLPCESYLDTGNRAAFTNGGTSVMLHPDFALKAWDDRACTRLVLKGPLLHAVKSRLLRHAAAAGHRLTDDPDLRVTIDDCAAPIDTDGRTWRVHLPPAAHELRMVSRHWVPAEMRADSDDTRRLGVAIADLRLDGVPIGRRDASLTAGWHAPEADWRWTTGDAALALNGARELVFELAMTGTYWRTMEKRRDTWRRDVG
jgi:hypothetical protein